LGASKVDVSRDEIAQALVIAEMVVVIDKCVDLGLAMVGEGRGIGEYHKDQIVFSQGDPADAVFYIQSGKVKVTVVSEQRKEAVVAMLGTNQFFGEGCLAGQARRIGHHDDGPGGAAIFVHGEADCFGAANKESAA
jgi:Cyclic nucleotide-binding domain